MKNKQIIKQVLDDHKRLKHVEVVYEWLKQRGINVADSPEELMNLTQLDLSECGLTELPNEFQYLRTRYLKLDGNNFGDGKKTLLPLCFMDNLAALGLSGCQLTSFPEQFKILKQFYQLQLENNQLTEFPRGVYELDYIDYLNICHNPIKFIPDDIIKNFKCDWLFIDSNEKQLSKKYRDKTKYIAIIQDLKTHVITL